MEMNGLYFWNAGPALKLSAREVANELAHGEEVAGLIDLPIKEILDRIKQAFPQCEEQPGRLVSQGAVGSFEITWGWQFVKAAIQDLPPGDRQRLIETIEEAGCAAYDAE